MVYINLPNNFNPKKIKKIGQIYTTQNFVLSDVQNIDIKNCYLTTCNGLIKYIVNVYDTYLFLIDECKTKKLIPTNIKKIDYLSKIIRFEYLLRTNSKKIIKYNIPSNIMVLSETAQWQNTNIFKEYSTNINKIISNNKPHLQYISNNYEKYVRFLCDNLDNYGFFKNIFAQNILYDNYIYILKDTDLCGHIIKYNHAPFEDNFL